MICMSLFIGPYAGESLDFIAARLSKLEHPNLACSKHFKPMAAFS